MTREDRTLGNKLLPKIASVVRETMISTKRAMLPWEHHVRVKATQDIIDRIGHEVAEHWRPFIDKMLEADDGSLSPELKQFLADSASGEDQLKAITGLLLGPVQSSIALILSNELAPVVYPIVSANPNLAVDVQSAANAAAQGITSYQEGAAAAAQQGFGAGQFNVFRDLAQQFPPVSDALDMYRRGDITLDALAEVIRRNAIPAQFAGPYEKLANNVLSLADAALAYLRSDITLDEARKIAHDNGYNDAQLDVFIGNTGEPLGLQQLLEGFRRKFIDQETLTRGIKQSRIRNEWTDLALKLRYAPMSIADAVNAVVQNHIDMARGEDIAQQNGLEPGSFGILYQTAGEPLSRTEMEELYNRGLVTRDDVSQALRESRLKNKYVDDAFALHTRLLEPRILSSAVEFGAVTHDEAIKRALEYGFSQPDAAILVNEGTSRKLHTIRQQSVSAAIALYADNAVSEDDLRGVMRSAGYEPAEADVTLKVAEYHREAKWITTVLSVVRSKYVAHHITKTQATHYIDSLSIPAARRDQLLTIWDMERAANVSQLTVAEIIKAMKKGTITPENALTRLENRGYTTGDAEILIADA